MVRTVARSNVEKCPDSGATRSTHGCAAGSVSITYLSDYFAPVSLLPDSPALPVLLKMGNDVSTDEILTAGAKVLPYRSNIQKSKTLHSNARFDLWSICRQARLTEKQVDMILADGLINWPRKQRAA
jgi:hypothetical protein